MNTLDQLIQTFNDNFVAYYRSHVAHVNITGRNFRSDHKLLEGVYTRRQDQIDRLAELIRTLDGFMPDEIQDVLNRSDIPTTSIFGDSDTLLTEVKTDLETLKGEYETLMATAESEGHEEIANYAQDQILDLAKSIWMLNATLS